MTARPLTAAVHFRTLQHPDDLVDACLVCCIAGLTLNKLQRCVTVKHAIEARLRTLFGSEDAEQWAGHYAWATEDGLFVDNPPPPGIRRRIRKALRRRLRTRNGRD